jgi:hypothetical protein
MIFNVLNYPDIQSAINAAAGQPVYVPAGIYQIPPLSYITTSSNVYTGGLQLIGEGSGVTTLQVKPGSNAPALTLDTNAVRVWRAQKGITIKGLTIIGGQDGLSLRHSKDVLLDDVTFQGQTRHGIHIICNEGDTDGTQNFQMNRCLLWGCQGWGINADCGTGHNEISVISLKHCQILECGTAAPGVYPPMSGGIRWRGQQISLELCQINENYNCGFFNYGGAGLANSILFKAIAFENNTGYHWIIQGCEIFEEDTCHHYSNDQFICRGCLFDPQPLIRNARVWGPYIRASAGNNQYTAFDATTPPAPNALMYVEIDGASWGNFGYAGQEEYGSGLRASIRPWIRDGGVTIVGAP